MSDEERGSKLIQPYGSLRGLIEDELRDLWQWGYDREPREESVQLRLDSIMRIIEENKQTFNK